MNDREIDRAAALVRRSPVTGRFTTRGNNKPPSQRYGSRWRALPVADDREEPFAATVIGWIGVAVGLALLVYMLSVTAQS